MKSKATTKPPRGALVIMIGHAVPKAAPKGKAAQRPSKSKGARA